MRGNTAKRIAVPDEPFHAVHQADKQVRQGRRAAAGFALLIAAGTASDRGAPLWCMGLLLAAALAALWAAGKDGGR